MTVRYLSVTPDTRKAGGDSAQPSIAERGLSALKWNYLGTGVRVVLQFVIGIVLARILGPEPFGLVGIAWFVIGYGYLVSEMGFSTALVQRRSIDDQDVRYVFTWVCVSAAAMTVLFVAAAPFIAAFFKRPDATVIIQVLSLYFVLQVIGQVPQSLLRRRMDYRSLQRAQVVSYTVAYLLLGIPLAMAGWGVWSLVVAALAQAVTGGLLMYTRAPHSLKPTLRSSNAGYVNFGAKVMATNVASHIMGSVDGIVVGRAFGALDLGLYNRTITLLFNSMLAVVSTLSSVLLSAYSRGQDNLPAARRAYLASLSVVGWLCAPPLLAAAAVPDTVIVALFGAEWAGAARLLTPLSIACLSAALTLVGGPLITGLGRPGTDMRVHMSAAALMIPLVIAASTVSLVAVAWSAVAAFVIRLLLTLGQAMRLTGAGWLDVSRALAGSLLVSVATGSTVCGTDRMVESLIPVAPWRLALDVLVAVITMAGATWGCKRILLTSEVGWLVGRIASRLPRGLVRWLGVSE